MVKSLGLKQISSNSISSYPATIQRKLALPKKKLSEMPPQKRHYYQNYSHKWHIAKLLYQKGKFKLLFQKGHYQHYSLKSDIIMIFIFNLFSNRNYYKKFLDHIDF